MNPASYLMARARPLGKSALLTVLALCPQDMTSSPYTKRQKNTLKTENQ